MRKKTDAINDISERTDLPKTTIEAVLNAQRESLHNALNKDGEYQLHEIGILKVGERPARKGRNPQTGDAIDIPAAKTVKFKVAKVLKDSVQ
jgi:DNA-binding protein HU-beta